MIVDSRGETVRDKNEKTAGHAETEIGGVWTKGLGE